jgi:hypothetical protein
MGRVFREAWNQNAPLGTDAPSRGDGGMLLLLWLLPLELLFDLAFKLLMLGERGAESFRLNDDADEAMDVMEASEASWRCGAL